MKKSTGIAIDLLTILMLLLIGWSSIIAGFYITVSNHEPFALMLVAGGAVFLYLAISTAKTSLDYHARNWDQDGGR